MGLIIGAQPSPRFFPSSMPPHLYPSWLVQLFPVRLRMRRLWGNSSAHTKERAMRVSYPPPSGPKSLPVFTISPDAQKLCRQYKHREMVAGAGGRAGARAFLPSFSVPIRFSERSRNWRCGRSRRFSTCLIWFPARDRKLQGKGRGCRDRAESQKHQREGGEHQAPGAPGRAAAG